MPIYVRGSSYVASVGSRKDRYRETFNTREEAEAAELAELLRRKTASKAPNRAQEATEKLPVAKTLKEAFERTYRLHWRGQKAEKTHVINAGTVLDALGEDTLVSDITADDISEMVADFEDRGNSGATVNKKMSSLSMMLKTAQQQWPGCLPTLPALIRRKENKHRIRWMDEAEEAKALAACGHLGLHDLRDYIIVAVDTGFRRGELLGFEVRDYANGLLHLHAGETKTDQARSVPATKRVDEVIQRRGNFRKLFPDLTVAKLRWQWDQLRGYMGLDDDAQFVVHMLRHTCASRMVQRGVPLAVVQKWMGHANIATTMRYAHLAPDSLLQAKEALEVEAKKIVLPAPPTLQPELADF